MNINAFPIQDPVNEVVERASKNRSDVLTLMRNNPSAYSFNQEELQYSLKERMGGSSNYSEHLKTLAADMHGLFEKEDMQKYMFDAVLDAWRVALTQYPHLSYLDFWKQFMNGDGRIALLNKFSAVSESYESGNTPYLTDSSFLLEHDMKESPLSHMSHMGRVLADLYNLPSDVEPGSVPSVQVLLKDMKVLPSDYNAKAKELGLVAGFGKAQVIEA